MIRRTSIAVIAAALILLANAAPAQAAGFDCSRAATAMQKRICANQAPQASPPRWNNQRREDAMKRRIHAMLAEVYASKKPTGFEQIGVHDIVVRHIPLATERSVILEAFKAQTTSKIIEDSADKLVVRDDRGKAMLDPDARSIVMTFSFGADGGLAKVDAVHIKNQ